jgi:crossover junction endodeoxyribonuclease RuvC
MITVIGIDPGLADTGLGIVRGHRRKIQRYAYGSITTSSNDPLPHRLAHIYTKLLDTLKTEKPDLVVVEDVFSLKRYPTSGITLGKVTGVILLAAHQVGAVTKEVPVREAKQVLTGNGNASKSQLEKAVRYLVKLDKPIKPYHASDALALAIIGLFRYGQS